MCLLHGVRSTYAQRHNCVGGYFVYLNVMKIFAGRINYYYLKQDAICIKHSYIFTPYALL